MCYTQVVKSASSMLLIIRKYFDIFKKIRRNVSSLSWNPKISTATKKLRLVRYLGRNMETKCRMTFGSDDVFCSLKVVAQRDWSIVQMPTPPTSLSLARSHPVFPVFFRILFPTRVDQNDHIKTNGTYSFQLFVVVPDDTSSLRDPALLLQACPLWECQVATLGNSWVNIFL